MLHKLKRVLVTSTALCMLLTPICAYADDTGQTQDDYTIGSAYVGSESSYRSVSPAYLSDGGCCCDCNMISYDPAVTIVHSINNTIPNAYYKPSINDIPLLEEKILKEGKFVSAYTGFFDLDKTDPYKPDTMQSRALELLGYDLLLESESYSPESGYQALSAAENVTRGKAVMDIYKALGLSQFDISLYYSHDHSITLENSPVAKGLPSYVTGLNTSRGKTDVFVTRSNKQLYFNKAERDLGISQSGMSDFISNGDFIVLLMRMMHFYGEPVMSDQEMNMLLQVYGADIPSYLTPIQQEAYLYLKSRGVLNVDLNYIEPLTLTNMLDILMCVFDEDSRTNFKEIQVTMDIGEDLISKGYFPRTVNLVHDDNAISFSSSYDYSNAKSYDYYIEITDQTRFVSKDGSPVDYLFIPETPADVNAPELYGSRYNGIARGEDGKRYYHFQIAILSPDSEYMQKSLAQFGTPNFIQANSRVASDDPSYIWFEQGGGVYTFASGPNHEGGITLHRRPFNEGEFEGSASVERVNQTNASSQTASAKVRNVLNKFSLSPITAYAANPINDWLTSNLTATIIVDNADKIISYDETILLKPAEKKNNQLIVTVPKLMEEFWKSTIVYDTESGSEDKVPGVSLGAISTTQGDMLIKYQDLVDMGLFFTEENGGSATPDADNDYILVLDSMFGQVKLNNQTNEIVVGNVLYKLPKNSNTVLFKYVTDNDGKSVLMIDFRAAFGWSNNIASIVTTGDGEGYTVSVKTQERANRSLLRRAKVKLPKPFISINDDNRIGVVQANRANKGDKCDKAVISAGYPLANWVVFSGEDATTGLSKSYAFVFYPKSAFNGNAPNDLDKLKSIVGYSIDSPDWACRVVEISSEYTDEPGKITYHENLGYIYNLPEWSDFTMDKYLSGEYLLPISKNGKEIVNACVNVFDGCPYGSRPTGNNNECIDIKGNKSQMASSADSAKTKAAPAGISVFFGGKKVPSKQASSSTLNASEGRASNSSLYYFGTSGFFVEKDRNGDFVASISFTSTSPYELTWKLDKADKLYKVYVTTESKNDNNGTYDYITRWVMYDTVLKSSTSVLEEQPPEEVKIADGEQKDKYNGFEEFSLEYLINMIDYSSSWIIYFVFKVIPLIGIVCITILVGISMISDMKIVRIFCEKLFDPVKILTLGRLTIEQLDFKKSFLGLMLGYIGFAFMLDGNLLRIIMWLLEFYDVIMELIKQF